MKVRAYAVFFKDKVTGELIGETEHSFSMDKSKEIVRVYSERRHLDKVNHLSAICDRCTTPEEYQSRSLKKGCDKWNKEHPKSKYTMVFYRLGTKNCPVKIDWTYRVLWSQKKVDWNKVAWRNLPFVIK